jgi:hypothetical protein
MHGRCHRIALLVALILAVAAPAKAESRPTDFEKGTWAVSTAGRFGIKWDLTDDANYGIASVGLGYYFIDRMALNAEAAGYFVKQDDEGNDALAASLNLRLRHHILERGRFSLFTDFGAGVFQADEPVPGAGTRFNFALDTGLGVTYRLRENVHFMTGAHYFHLSNARIQGVERNPGINAWEGYIGFIFTF